MLSEMSSSTTDLVVLAREAPYRLARDGLPVGAQLGGDFLLDVALGRVRRSQQRQRSSSNEPAASESRLRSVGEVQELCKAEQLHFSSNAVSMSAQSWVAHRPELAYVRH